MIYELINKIEKDPIKYKQKAMKALVIASFQLIIGMALAIYSFIKQTDFTIYVLFKISGLLLILSMFSFLACYTLMKKYKDHKYEIEFNEDYKQKENELIKKLLNDKLTERDCLNYCIGLQIKYKHILLDHKGMYYSYLNYHPNMMIKEVVNGSDYSLDTLSSETITNKEAILKVMVTISRDENKDRSYRYRFYKDNKSKYEKIVIGNDCEDFRDRKVYYNYYYNDDNIKRVYKFTEWDRTDIVSEFISKETLKIDNKSIEIKDRFKNIGYNIERSIIIKELHKEYCFRTNCITYFINVYDLDKDYKRVNENGKTLLYAYNDVNPLKNMVDCFEKEIYSNKTKLKGRIQFLLRYKEKSGIKNINEIKD